MSSYDNFHSRLVGWSKILLPLAALGLLSTLFLFARKSGDTSEIPFAEIEARALDQGISAPQFSGVAGDGSVIQITAVAARPTGETVVAIEEPQLSLDAADGSTVRIVAGQGTYDDSLRQAQLTGLARLETSTGYVMETAGLTANMDTGIVTSLGPLEVQSPLGALTAGRVTILTAQDGSGQQMHFTQGVKLVYRPE